MSCDYLRAIGLVLLLGCGLSAASAGEPPGDASPPGGRGSGLPTAAVSRAEATGDVSPRGQAWAVLTRNPPEEDPAVLSRAILAVVRARVPEDLDRLATYMQSHVFGEDFAIPPEPQLLLPTLGTCPFKELMRSIAECDTSFAEELLVLYAQSGFISQERPIDHEHRFRRSYVLQALGCLHPKTDGTYSLLDKELMPLPRRQGEPIDEDAFTSLVSIGDERAAGILRREAFPDPRNWAETRVSGLAKGRDKPANFELLFSLAQQASAARSQERVLTYLVERQVRRGTGGIIFVYPGYDNVPLATRDKLLKVVSAADRTKFSAKAVELLDRLKEEFSNPKAVSSSAEEKTEIDARSGGRSPGPGRVRSSAEEKAEIDYSEAIRQNPNDAQAYYNRGVTRYRMRDTRPYESDYREALTNNAVADYKEAIRLDPNYAAAYDALAWLRATDADPWHRDGKEAVASAKKACEVSGWTNWHYLHTLAAADAEAGDFGSAVYSETKAIELLGGDAAATADMKGLRSALELFKQGEPYHQPRIRRG
jgi:tetratricopeptide (TPR) repeat protein